MIKTLLEKVSMMTSTITLTIAADKLFTEDTFLGVFASDTLPKTAGPFHHKNLIINTDTSNLPGTHWIAITSRDDEAYYFDPFGYSPPLNIVTWLNTHFNTWTCNRRQVQAITSTYCGYFCLHFLFAANVPYFKNIKLNRIIDHLYPKTLHYSHYETIVNDFIKTQGL